ncbi:ABC transporter ATP-binding protein [Candidatus Methylopumilus planktonicus]|jgi:putative ABC transport system ATP-binding protein|uniref:ABC transporter ATP-binding protein n=1 Tax=Candidatus Methylopumilus planktonicus TaxID=1581557 RepID=UPI003BEF1F1F
MTKKVIEIQGLYKDYNTAAGVFPVLKDVNLTIDDGDYVAIMGPSGSGKSTFMNILGCLDRPTKGEYILDGHSVKSLSSNELAKLRNKTIGFVFQGFNLLARSTLVENVSLPLVYAEDQKELRNKIAKNILERMGLGNYFNSKPSQISGGQQQRVAIARALVNQPRIILADEPTGNLDSKTSDEIMKIFDELNQIGNTIIIVTHENDIAEHASRQIRFLDGKIVEDSRNKEKAEA